jgi:hypothetical protein
VGEAEAVRVTARYAGVRAVDGCSVELSRGRPERRAASTGAHGEGVTGGMTGVPCDPVPSEPAVRTSYTSPSRRGLFRRKRTGRRGDEQYAECGSGVASIEGVVLLSYAWRVSRCPNVPRCTIRRPPGQRAAEGRVPSEGVQAARCRGRAVGSWSGPGLGTVAAARRGRTAAAVGQRGPRMLSMMRVQWSPPCPFSTACR